MKKLTVLQFLCSQFGWQGGTIHQALQELKNRCNSELGYLVIRITWQDCLKENLIDVNTAGYKEVGNILK